MLKYLIENGCPTDLQCCINATQKYNSQCLQYLHENGLCPFDIKITNMAASRYSYKCLEYAIKNGFPYNLSTWNIVVKLGDLKMMKMLYKSNCELPKFNDSVTCNMLVRNNELKCLQWAHENNFYWNEKTCSKAAKFNNLKCLKYLHENGCPWDQETLNKAFSFKSRKCLEYAKKNNCPGHEKFPNYLMGSDFYYE